jgi:hypothetical protein
MLGPSQRRPTSLNESRLPLSSRLLNFVAIAEQHRPAKLARLEQAEVSTKVEPISDHCCESLIAQRSLSDFNDSSS